MKANELMIDDWVQGFLPDTYSQVYGVINECRVAIVGGGAYMEVSNEDIQPIPLTREILDKNFNGYGGSMVNNKNHRYYDIDIDYVIISYPSGEVTFCYNYEDSEIAAHDKIGLVDMKYVHTLQHALKLCGIDKEIVL